MNKKWYKITGISLIVFVLVVAVLLLILGVNHFTERSFKLVYTCAFFNGCPATLGSAWISFLLFLDYILTLLIFLIFLAQSFFYIKIKEKSKNVLTDWSVKLALTGLVIFLLTILFTAIGCGGVRTECFAWSMILGIFPIGFAGILYLISLLLLGINWVKNH